MKMMDKKQAPTQQIPPRRRSVVFEDGVVPTVSINVILALLEAEEDLLFSGRPFTSQDIMTHGYRRARCTRMDLMAGAARLNAWRGGEVVVDPLRESIINSAVLGRERMCRHTRRQMDAVRIIAAALLRISDANQISDNGVLMTQGVNAVDMVGMRRSVAHATCDA